MEPLDGGLVSWGGCSPWRSGPVGHSCNKSSEVLRLLPLGGTAGEASQTAGSGRDAAGTTVEVGEGPAGTSTAGDKEREERDGTQRRDVVELCPIVRCRRFFYLWPSRFDAHEVFLPWSLLHSPPG